MTEQMPSGLSMVEELYAIEQIKRLKAKYFRCVDTRDWRGFESVFTADVVIDFRGTTTDTGSEDVGLDSLDNGELFRGAVAWAARIRDTAIGQNLTSMHHGHMPEIEITSPTTAKAIWAMEDIVYWPPGAEISRMHGWGHYYETYEKVGGQWLISSVRLARVRLDLHREGAAG